jgi:hypothetical protein
MRLSKPKDAVFPQMVQFLPRPPRSYPIIKAGSQTYNYLSIKEILPVLCLTV